MWTDPIVEETRKIRNEIASGFDYDPIKLGEYFKSMKMADLVARIKAAAEQIPSTSANTPSLSHNPYR